MHGCQCNVSAVSFAVQRIMGHMVGLCVFVWVCVGGWGGGMQARMEGRGHRRWGRRHAVGCVLQQKWVWWADEWCYRGRTYISSA